MASTTEDGALQVLFKKYKLTLYLTKKGRRVLGVTFHDTSSWCHGITWICTLIPDEYSPYINVKFLQQLSALKEKFATHGRLTRIQIDRRMFVFRHETEDKAIEMLGSYTIIEEIILKFLRETGAQVTDITMKSEVDEAAASIDQETLPRGTTDQDVLFSSKHGDDVDAPHSHLQQRHDDIPHAQEDEEASHPHDQKDEDAAHLLTALSDPSQGHSKSKRDPRLSTTSHATPSEADRDLYWASWDWDLVEVKRLLSTPGVDVNCRVAWWSMTPVLAAAYKGHRDVVELLVSEGADVSLVDMVGDNILHYACMRGDLEMVKYVLSLNVVDIDARNMWGQTAADVARSEGHQPVLDLLVSRGAQ